MRYFVRDMSIVAMLLYLSFFLVLNIAVLRALLACRTWPRVMALFLFALIGAAPVSLLLVYLMGDAPLRPIGVMLLFVTSVTGQIFLYFWIHFINVMFQKRPTDPSYLFDTKQGLGQDYLSSLPNKRLALAIFILVCLVETFMITLNHEALNSLK